MSTQISAKSSYGTVAGPIRPEQTPKDPQHAALQLAACLTTRITSLCWPRPGQHACSTCPGPCAIARRRAALQDSTAVLYEAQTHSRSPERQQQWHVSMDADLM